MAEQTHFTTSEIADSYSAPSWLVRRIVDALGDDVPRAGLYRLVPSPAFSWLFTDYSGGCAMRFMTTNPNNLTNDSEQSMPTNRTSAPASGAYLWTLAQLAEVLRVDRRTVERWASAGRIPGRIQLSPRAIRYCRDDVLQWIEDGCPRPSE
jgi:excisionase family DNA binding protein